MGLLAVLGAIAIVVGFLGLFKIVALGLAASLVLVVVGVLLVVFGGGYVRRG